MINRQRLEKIKRKLSDPKEKDNSTTKNAFTVDDGDGIHSADAILVGLSLAPVSRAYPTGYLTHLSTVSIFS